MASHLIWAGAGRADPCETNGEPIPKKGSGGPCAACEGRGETSRPHARRRTRCRHRGAGGARTKSKTARHLVRGSGRHAGLAGCDADRYSFHAWWASYSPR